jgi:hypothetical protein
MKAEDKCEILSDLGIAITLSVVQKRIAKSEDHFSWSMILKDSHDVNVFSDEIHL